MPSLSMRSAGSLALSASVLPGLAPGHTSYKILESWEGENILNHFSFFDRGDPTNGFVTYVNQSYAEDSGLVKITPTGGLYMGVDYETVLSSDGPGRESVRIESNQYYDEGLYIVDIQHMPGSICGTWPAFWTVGANWPYDGEIDIVEGVNMHEANNIVLHTSGSCDVGGGHEMSGDMTSGECGEASGTIGCVVKGQQGSSGTPFNEQGGGVYAMEWQTEFLKIWFFPRSSIPASITAGNPDTSEFGTPMAHLQGTCNFSERYASQKLIFDTTFCGDWAGGVFGDSGCPLSDASNPMRSCVDYVAQNPAKFKEAYWEINSLKIYQAGGAADVESTPKSASTSTTKTVAEPTTQTVASSTTTSISTKETSTTTIQTTTTSTVTDAEAGAETSTTTSSATQDAFTLPTATVTDSEPSTTTTTNTTTTTSAGAPPSASSDEESEDNMEPVSKITSYVTMTTTLCPLSQSRPLIPTPDAVLSSSVPSSKAATTPISKPSANTKNVVDGEAPPATVISSQADVPSAPTPSVVSTASKSRPVVPSWVIVPSSSQIVAVPTGADSSSPGDAGDTPSGFQTETSATAPSSPVFTGDLFTGTGSRLSISASGIVAALAIVFLA